MNKSRCKWKTPSLETPYLKETRESILYFKHNKTQMSVFGIGRIIKIEQGAKADIVYMDVGRGYRIDYCKKLIAMTQDARKQVYTLTHRHYCMFYGVKQKGTKGIYVLSFFPAFVPKLVDRNMLMEENEGEIEKLEVEIENNDKDINDFLTQFERNK